MYKGTEQGTHVDEKKIVSKCSIKTNVESLVFKKYLHFFLLYLKCTIQYNTHNRNKEPFCVSFISNIGKLLSVKNKNLFFYFCFHRFMN